MPLAIFLVSFGLLFLGMHPQISLYDEGIVLVGAERVMRGDVPYRDFWTMYGPAQFYLVSFLYSVFGVSDLTLRVYGIVVKAVITTLAYLLILRFGRRALALTGAMVVLLLLIGAHNNGFPVFPAVALVMMSLLLLDRREGAETRNFCLAGICIGAATVFRQDLGVYAALGISVCCLLTPSPRNALSEPNGGDANGAKRLIWFGLGFTIVVLPVALSLVGAVPLRDLQENLLTIPFSVYPTVRSLPFPAALTIADDLVWFHPRIYVPFSVYVPFIVTVWVAALELRRRRAEPPSSQVAVGMLIPALALINLLFTLKGFVRVSPLHFVQSMVLSVVLLLIGVARIDWLKPHERMIFAPGLIAALSLVSVTAVFGVYAVVMAVNGLPRQTNNLITRCLQPELPRLRCASVDADTLATARFVKANSRDDETIFVGTNRHDKIMTNDMGLYFLSERTAVTKWQELHPGVQTTEKVQREIVNEMKHTPPAFVILKSTRNDQDEPNASRFSSGVFVLDDYIHAQFIELRRFGSIQVLARR